MINPQISVLIATHNRREMLDSAVQSVLAQSCSEVEVIIADDASSDSTAAYIDKLACQDGRIHALHLAVNSGPGAARNAAAHISCGKYIAVLDDDDTSLPGRLQIQRDYLEAHPELSGVFSTVYWDYGPDHPRVVFPEIIQRGEFPREPGQAFELLYTQSNKIPNPTLMLRREVFLMNPYSETIWVGEDWLLFMQLFASGLRLYGFPQPMVCMKRESGHASLVRVNEARRFRFQRQVLSEIRRWLDQRRIHDFDHLHKMAYANQLIREARAWSGLRGLGLSTYAWLLMPENPYARETINWLIGKARKKMGFS